MLPSNTVAPRCLGARVRRKGRRGGGAVQKRRRREGKGRRGDWEGVLIGRKEREEGEG